jgi:hypothetical protein
MNEILGNQANHLVRSGSLEMVSPAPMVVPRALGGKTEVSG